jgi:hypothetical protein
MSPSLDDLYQQRKALLDQMHDLPAFRRGSLIERKRTCGKPACHCQKDPSSSHSQFQWSVSIHGKTRSKNLHLGPEVEKYLMETQAHQRFLDLISRYVQITEHIADLLEPQPVHTEKELETLKKKLQRQLSQRQKRKSGV